MTQAQSLSGSNDEVHNKTTLNDEAQSNYDVDDVTQSEVKEVEHNDTVFNPFVLTSNKANKSDDSDCGWKRI